ncbi:MAG: LamG domain-containing protein [Bacteroidales bacterium]|nr:LamG domain-containing protein [Bacteroidales bacterium]
MKRLNLFSVFAVIALSIGMLFTSCKTEEPDPYEGKTDPSTIATANLVAHFPLESATGAIEIGTGITYGKLSGAGTFAVGRRGNAYKGSTAPGYLEFNVATSANLFKSMTEYTYAAWIKCPKPTDGAATAFALNGGDANMGNLNFIVESGSNADSLALKSYLYNSTTNWKGQDFYLHNKAFLSDKWVHIVSSYNKATSTMTYYANGVLVKTQIKYADGEVGGVQPKLGALTFGSDMTKLDIGAWPKLAAGTATDSWMVYYPGLIDEIRIYNKALTDAEVKALYDAEITVIN